MCFKVIGFIQSSDSHPKAEICDRSQTIASRDNSGAGRVQINDAISTLGGNITVKGTSNGTDTHGILVNSPINSGGGNITFNGTGTSVGSGLSAGIFVNENETIVLFNRDYQGNIPDNDKTLALSDQLQLLVVTADGKAIGRRVPNTTCAQVVAMASLLRSRITDPRQPRHRYIPMAEQLDQWLVAPIKRDLQAEGIQNLVYIMDVGLRSLPMPALYDGRKFLIERYSIGMMPSLGLTNTQYQDIQKSQVLAMGASQFTDELPLPAVPVELSLITPRLWQGKSYLNQGFTLNNLKAQRRQKSFGIVHLATHARFRPGTRR